MERFNSFYALNVFVLERDTWEYPRHRHNFYELILIESGSGKHLLNDIEIPYRKGDVFLMGPDDAHYFVVARKTRFLFVKFTEQILFEKLDGNRKGKWADAVRGLLRPRYATTGSIVRRAEDRRPVFLLARLLLAEFGKSCLYSREAVLELFGALMIFIARNDNPAPLNREKDRTGDILGYIRLHVGDREKVTREALAAQFHLSPNYIGIYVRKHTGLSLQQHIMQTRIKAAELLLKQSRLNISEIAERLGFNDASHFNKLFRKYRGMNPGAFTR
ncbi:AraC family transcriptional regulator [Taibaiella helva]|uniref:AraC family transcriptional regulator n=1 Tax=Taibaiella helva TaxID=2301235 RepID=UPI0018E59518|nr:AraC family transcriptional regulator [Taibaiella helva]